MRTVEFLGAGFVWESDDDEFLTGYDDFIGNFQWKLEVQQNGIEIISDLTIIEKFSDWDGWYSYEAEISKIEQRWFCVNSKKDRSESYFKINNDKQQKTESRLKKIDISSMPKIIRPEAILGKRITVECLLHSSGKNSGVGLGGKGGVGPTGPSGGIDVSYNPGYGPSYAKWVFKIMVCPGRDECPQISILQHIADWTYKTEVYWASRDEFLPGNPRVHMPQVCQGKCDQIFDLKGTNFLPLICKGEKLHTAKF